MSTIAESYIHVRYRELNDEEFYRLRSLISEQIIKIARARYGKVASSIYIFKTNPL